MVKPSRDLVWLYRINDLQRFVTDASAHSRRLGRSRPAALRRLKNRKLSPGRHRIVALSADKDSGKIVKHTPKIVGRVPYGERYGHINRLKDHSGPVRRVSIKVELNFAANRWRAALEIGPDPATEISYMLLGPIKLGVDIAELLVQWGYLQCCGAVSRFPIRWHGRDWTRCRVLHQGQVMRGRLPATRVRMTTAPHPHLTMQHGRGRTSGAAPGASPRSSPGGCTGAIVPSPQPTLPSEPHGSAGRSRPNPTGS